MQNRTTRVRRTPRESSASPAAATLSKYVQRQTLELRVWQAIERTAGAPPGGEWALKKMNDPDMAALTVHATAPLRLDAMLYLDTVKLLR
jgi:hypothetical protein